MADARAILRRVPMFSELSDDDCDAVLRVLKGRQGRPGDTLFREGDRGDTLMIVVDGQLEASVTAPDGAQAQISVIQPGHVVGELAFLDAAPRSATVSTRSGATVLEFSRAALLVLCRDKPRIAAAIQRNVLADLSRRVRATEGTVLSNTPVASARSPEVHAASQRVEPRESLAPMSAHPKGRPVTAAQLRAIPALATHSAEDLELLAYMALMRGFARGEVLMRMGAAGDAAFLISSGNVSVSRGGNAPLATLGPGALVGQLALIDRAPRSATITAATDVTALELKANVFANLVNASSPLALRFQREVAGAAARHLRAANARFAAAASAGPSSSQGSSTSLHDMEEGDWSTGSDEPIELDIDLNTLRH